MLQHSHACHVKTQHVPKPNGARPAAYMNDAPHVMRDGNAARIGYAPDAGLLLYGYGLYAHGIRQAAREIMLGPTVYKQRPRCDLYADGR